MKHWHRCRRWTEKGLICPLRGRAEHEDMRDESDEVTSKEGALKGAPVLLPLKIPGPPKVRVREPRRAAPARSEAVVSKRPPVVRELLADLVTTVIEGIGQVPRRAVFEASDFAFLEKEVGLVRFQAGKGGVRESIGLQTAEEAVSRVTRAESQITSEKVQGVQVPRQNRSPGFPLGLFALPLMYEILKLVDLRAGAAHLPPPLRTVSEELLKGRQLRDPNLAREFEKPGGVPRKPIPRGAGGARGGTRNVNAETLLQGMIRKANRKLVPLRSARPAGRIRRADGEL